ncbi:MAG: class 1b ribonucleoside-diphosphate reductase subunit beta [Defluviitaleaceae bacterium]|nr:class 1b ribonucleoside-diphosphate reductase subunit beta [Defluviitaleaceae bacterium]
MYKREESKNKQAVNWNKINDSFTTLFWQQNIRQFWIDEEIPLSDDKLTWQTLSEEEKEVYKKVTAGLTLLDTEQGSVGMPEIALAVENLHSKAILSFMGMMEHMHAKSYSSIFSTLCTSKEIDDLFEWVENEPLLQKKLQIVTEKYKSIKDDKTLYLAMVMSVFLESFLFYSGFFYPLYLAGEGKLTASGEIINLIIRDESIHGVYVGLLAQEIFKTFSDFEKENVKKLTIDCLKELFEIEEEYTKQIYSPIGLVEEVLLFLKYNADKALMNLGMDAYFNISEDKVNSIVIAGLDTKTKHHDFFSVKGNGYIKPLNISKLDDSDFDF